MLSLQEKIDLIKNNKAVALLAPSFPIDFKYPEIIGMLKRLGFDQVTELTYGARMVNWAYAQYIKDNPGQRLFIASPCPVVVSFIKAQYPDYADCLMPIASPMAAMAKVYRKYHPDHKIVFISPCYAKENIEAPRYPEVIDAVITLKDLKEILKKEGINEEDFTEKYQFDSFIREFTKIYPISGGLAATSHIGGLFGKDEILVTDGLDNIKKAMEEIKAGQSKYKFLDILNCPGGCTGGPTIANASFTVEQKRKIVNDYTKESSKDTMGERKGRVCDAGGVDLAAKF